jgi:hypothetical protein
MERMIARTTKPGHRQSLVSRHPAGIYPQRPGERGMSRRRSVELLNFLLEQIKQALARGEELEFPWREAEAGAAHVKSVVLTHFTQAGVFPARASRSIHHAIANSG